MRPIAPLSALLVVAATMSTSWAQDHEPVDGIAAIVNGEVISHGQVARAEAVLRHGELQGLLGDCGAPARTSGGTASAGSEAATQEAGDRSAEELALECLIDSTVVFREVRRVSQLLVRTEEIEEAYAELVAEHGSEAALAEELRSFGMTPQAARDSLQRQLMIARYVDRRFRATVDISESASRRHYEEVLGPDMEARGIAPPPFEQVDEEFVRPILREREVNRRVQSWIDDLHARATIVRIRP